MLAKKRTLSAVACLLMLVVVTTVRPQTPDSCYKRLPKVLSNQVDIAVLSILQQGADELGVSIPHLVSYTVADVVASKEMGEETYQFYGEVRRTDQQVGASATSSGSTSAVEKPGLISLIGFAIERGAIQQSVSDSTVTLTTSPYAFVAVAKGDSPTTYQNNELLTRLGVSATFILNDPKNTLASLSRKQLTEWSAKLRLTGDRSTRSRGFRIFWDEKLGKLEQTRLNIMSAMESKIFNIPGIVNSFMVGADGDAVTPLLNKIKAYLTANTITPAPTQTTFPEVHRSAIKEMILCTLFDKVHEPVRNGTIKVDEVALKTALSQLAEVQRLITAARKTFQEDVNEWVKKGNLSTFVYTNHRVAEGSDYSEFKLLFERHVKPLEVVLNANFSIYNKPDPAKNQDKLRDFSLSGSLEWASKRNPLFRGDEEMATPITISMNGRYERLKENENMAMREPDIGSFQARIEIPVAPGLSIPIAYTYATATETTPKRENRFNVGLHLDVHKILSFKRATNAQ